MASGPTASPTRARRRDDAEPRANQGAHCNHARYPLGDRGQPSPADILALDAERLIAEVEQLCLENAQIRQLLEQVASDYTRRVGKLARAFLGKE